MQIFENEKVMNNDLIMFCWKSFLATGNTIFYLLAFDLAHPEIYESKLDEQTANI
ncbi:MAG: hypothetical protein WCX32_02775 [Clostridia bacterium]|jgi:hypothetical protein|nr:hypothetical protein [Clostridia bacterium]MDD4275864.1 hypothetical protein [Clostridia bacterium]